MEKEKKVFNNIFTQTFANFGICILVVSTVAYIMGETQQVQGGMMRLAGEGLSYTSILQLLLYAWAITGISYVAMKISMQKQILVIWRFIIEFFVIVTTTILFAVLFKWFPIDNLQAWISFIISFSVCMTLTFVVIIVKIKLDDKRYQKQLAEYKANLKKEGS